MAKKLVGIMSVAGEYIGSGEVTSVNGKTGTVVLSASDVNALPANTTIPSKTSDLNNDSGFITKSVNDLTNYTLSSNLASVATSGSYSDLSNTPTIPTVPTDVSAFNNDAGYITAGIFSYDSGTNTLTITTVNNNAN